MTQGAAPGQPAAAATSTPEPAERSTTLGTRIRVRGVEYACRLAVNFAVRYSPR